MRRLLAVTLAIGVLAAVLLGPRLGGFLFVQDPLQRADVIYVLAGTRVTRPLEGADLFREGYAPRILLSDGAPEAAEVALERRGIDVIGDADRARAILTQLGVPADAILVADRPVNSTRAEAQLLRELAARYSWSRAIVVTSKLHTRRARLAMRRELDGAGLDVIVRGSRHEESNPARWWSRRADVRMVLTELQFLLAYALGLA